MKKKIVILIVFNLLLHSKVTSQATNKNHNQSKNNLKELLWSSIQSTLDYTDSKGNIDSFITVIEDVKNGYLKVSGEFPPCGCPISETVVAFKDTKGNYTFLEEETDGCNWKYQLSSNTNLAAILPENFGIKTFIPTLKNDVTKQAFFYLEIDIPQHGTETKVRLKMIPIGMHVKSKNLLVYDISQNNPNTQIQNWNSATMVSKLSDKDLDAIINNPSKKQSTKKLNSELKKLKTIYKLYTSIAYKELILSWDKKKARFVIKEKCKVTETLSFYQFLKMIKYWSALC